MIPYKGADANFSLEGKTAIITGGTAGLGYATADFLSKKGVNLILMARSSNVDSVAKKFGEKNIGVQGDVCDSAARKSVLDAGIKAFGKVDILINNAGISLLDKAESISEEYWNKVIGVNLTACFMMAQIFGVYLIENKITGAIVNVSSQAGVSAVDRHVAYCASKAGVNSITRVLALEWGKYGIRVNAVSPTVVLTELGRKVWDNPKGEEIKKILPAGRFPEPDEVAGVIAFLCSDAAAMVTGHNLMVDGGACTVAAKFE